MHVSELEISLTFHDRQRKFFANVSEKDAYVKYETKACMKEFRAYCAAISIEKRKEALLALNNARLKCFEQWTKRHIQKPNEVA